MENTLAQHVQDLVFFYHFLHVVELAVEARDIYDVQILQGVSLHLMPSDIVQPLLRGKFKLTEILGSHQLVNCFFLVDFHLKVCEQGWPILLDLLNLLLTCLLIEHAFFDVVQVLIRVGTRHDAEWLCNVGDLIVLALEKLLHWHAVFEEDRIGEFTFQIRLAFDPYLADLALSFRGSYSLQPSYGTSIL